MTDLGHVRHVVEIVDYLGRVLRIETTADGKMRATIILRSSQQEKAVAIDPAAQGKLDDYLTEHRTRQTDKGTNPIR